MKIAIWHNLFSGGGSRALHQHIKGLAERGHHIEIWTSSLADSAFLDVDSYIQELHVLPLDMTVRIRYQHLDKVPALGFEPDTQVRECLISASGAPKKSTRVDSMCCSPIHACIS